MIFESFTTLVLAIGSMYIWETQIRDRIWIRRIISDKDKDAKTLLEFYQDLFPEDGTNYSLDEMVEILDGSSNFSKGYHAEVENLVLIAKFHRDVVGFIICHYYPERKKSIIS